MGARSQLQRFLAEVGRFLLVGGGATVVALLIFNVLAHGLLVGSAPLSERPLTAYVLANTVGMLVSYQGSRRFVFADRDVQSADGGFTAYVAINYATMTIPVACLAISRDVLGLDDPFSDNIAANIVGAWLGLAARFYLFRTYVFKRPIHLAEMYDEPGADAQGEDPRAELSEEPRGSSTSRPDVAPGPAARAG